MKIDPYLTAILYGDGSVSLRKDGAYAIWIDQAEINRDIMVNEVIPRLRHLGSKVYVYRYYAKKDKTYKFRALIYSKQSGTNSFRWVLNTYTSYRFGRIFGLQIYRRNILSKFFEEIPAWKLKSRFNKIFGFDD